MVYLKINYKININENLMFIKNLITEDIVFAFKVNNSKIYTIINKLYFGFQKENINTAEDKIINVIMSKKPELFIEYSDKKKKVAFEYFRNIDEIICKSFINNDYYKSYIDSIESYMSNNKLIKLFVDLDYRFNELENKIKSIPYFEISYDDICDIGIVSRTKFDYNKHTEFNNILVVDINNQFLEIGPLLHNYKFNYNLDLEDKENYSIRLMNSEISLISVFLDKILFLLAFNILDKTRDCGYVPNRFKLKFNRSNLVLETEDIKMKPKFLSVENNKYS